MRKERFVIESEPIGKARPRFTRSGHAYSPQKNKEYEKAIKQAYNGNKFDGAVYLRITAYCQKPKRCKILFPTKKPDIDNIAKIIMDGLNGSAWDDDKQVIWLTACKKWTDDYPRVEVEITEWVE